LVVVSFTINYAEKVSRYKDEESGFQSNDKSSQPEIMMTINERIKMYFKTTPNVYEKYNKIFIGCCHKNVKNRF
jgi:hypothetical protein